MASGNAGFHAGSLENLPARQGLAGVHPNPQVASESKSPFDLNGGYDAEKANQHFSALPTTTARNRPRSSRTVSWDIFSGLRNLDHSYDDFDTKNAANLPKVRSGLARPRTWLMNPPQASKLYILFRSFSIVTKWFFYIVPLLGILWIPGILGLTKFPSATVCLPSETQLAPPYLAPQLDLGCQTFVVEHLALCGLGW